MKLTVILIGLLSIASVWAAEQKLEDLKEKREAPLGYPSSGHSSQTLQIQPSLSHDDSNAISISAGYSIGGAKQPSLSYGGHLSGLQLEALPSGGGHSTLQLPPLTLQSNHGGIVAGDISQLMSQLTHGLSTGSLQLQSLNGEYSSDGLLNGHEAAQPQYSYGAPSQHQYSVSEQQSSVPSYAVGTKGLGSYGSGPTGPVLFNPSSLHNLQAAPSFGGFSSGHHGALSFGGSGHSFGGGLLKGLNNHYGSPSKSNFKPSAFLGASLQNDQTHPISGLSTHALPSFGHAFSHSHGPISLLSGGPSSGSFSGGSSKLLGPSYLPPKSGGYSSSSESLSSLSGGGHYASPPGTTYGIPTSSYGLSGNSAHGEHSSPQYYISSSKHGGPSTFGESSSSYKGALGGQSLLGGHGSLSGHGSLGGHSFLSGHSLSGGQSSLGGQGLLSSHSSLGGYGSLGSHSALGGHGTSAGLSSLSGHGSLGGHSALGGHGTSAGLSSLSGHGSLGGHSALGGHGTSAGLSSLSGHGSLGGHSSLGSHSSLGAHGISGGLSSLSGHGSQNSYASGPKYIFGAHSGITSKYASPKDSHGAYSEPSYNTIKYSEEMKPRAH